MTLKVGAADSQRWSMFEVVNIPPGFDVGAHLHHHAEELFYVLEGEMDLLAFEPRDRTPPTGVAGSRSTAHEWPGRDRAASYSFRAVARMLSQTRGPLRPA